MLDRALVSEMQNEIRKGSNASIKRIETLFAAASTFRDLEMKKFEEYKKISVNYRPIFYTILSDFNRSNDFVDNQSAFSYALQNKRIDIAIYLLETDEENNIKNYNKNTALMIAAVQGNLDIVQLLIHQGAKDPEGKAFSFAATRAFESQSNFEKILDTFLKNAKKIGLSEEHLTQTLINTGVDYQPNKHIFYSKLVLSGADARKAYAQDKQSKYVDVCRTPVLLDFIALTDERLKDQQWSQLRIYANDDPIRINFSLGNLCERDGDLIRAEELYTKAAIGGYEAAYRRLGQLDEAKNKFESAGKNYMEALKKGDLLAPGKIVSLIEKLKKAKNAAYLPFLREMVRYVKTKDFNVHFSVNQWALLANYALSDEAVKQESFETAMQANRFAQQALMQIENSSNQSNDNEQKEVKILSRNISRGRVKLQSDESIMEFHQGEAQVLTSLIADFVGDDRVRSKLFSFFEPKEIVTLEIKGTLSAEEDRFNRLKKMFELRTKFDESKCVERIRTTFAELAEEKNMSGRMEIMLGCIVSEYRVEKCKSFFMSNLAAVLNKMKNDFLAVLKNERINVMVLSDDYLVGRYENRYPSNKKVRVV